MGAAPTRRLACTDPTSAGSRRTHLQRTNGKLRDRPRSRCVIRPFPSNGSATENLSNKVKKSPEEGPKSTHTEARRQSYRPLVQQDQANRQGKYPHLGAPATTLAMNRDIWPEVPSQRPPDVMAHPDRADGRRPADPPLVLIVERTTFRRNPADT